MFYNKNLAIIMHAGFLRQRLMHHKHQNQNNKQVHRQ